jgi:hypothetical protein
MLRLSFGVRAEIQTFIITPANKRESPASKLGGKKLTFLLDPREVNPQLKELYYWAFFRIVGK